MRLRDALDPEMWRRLFEGSENSDRLRSRVLATAGVWFLLAGFLATLGFAIVVLASFALLLTGAFLAGALWLGRRYRVGRELRLALERLGERSRGFGARLDEVRPQRYLRRTATVAANRVGAVVAGSVSRAKASASEQQPALLKRQALRLNELGVHLRREGNHEEAVQRHQAALAILRELGDRRAEALTLNNLALALVHTAGGVPIAVQHFEQAATVLRELGDEEHEGQVIANLGFVRRRQGRDDDAVSLLHAALDKLPPDSPAYQQVEEQLRRAS